MSSAAREAVLQCNAMNAAENGTPRTWLGLVVAAQFAAVAVANVAGFLWPIPDPTSGVPVAPPHGPGSLAQYAAERYLEATGQPQGWGMFQDGYMRNSVAWDLRIDLDGERVARVQGVAR